MQTAGNTAISFGEFELDPLRRRLSKGGRPVALKPKAFDLLLTLIERRGEVVSKNDLLDRVWENQFVEENNLTVHMAALRKALGEIKNEHRYIITVPGSGYKFVAELNEQQPTEITVESHSFEHVIFEREIEAEIIQEKNTTRWSAIPLNGRKTLFSRIAERKAATGLIIAALTAGLVGGGYSLRPRFAGFFASAEPSAPPTVTQHTFTTSGGVPQRVAIAPDGRSLAYIQRFKGKDSLWLGDLNTSNSIQISEASDRLHEFLTFAPDGRSLYFTARDDYHLVWTLMNVSIYGGPARTLITGVHSPISFSPDGKRLAFLRKDAATGRKSLITANTETGDDERIFVRSDEPTTILGHGVAWSPDGNVIAIGISDDSGNVCSIVGVDPSSGVANKIRYIDCKNSLNNLAWLRDGSGLVINRGEGKGAQLWLVSYPLGAEQRITNDTLNYSGYSLSVSDDDTIAVLQARTDPKIWLTEDSDPANARQILEGSRLRSEGMRGLSFSSDGNIFYTVRTGDSGTIWEMNADGSNRRQLTASQKESRDLQINSTTDNRFLVFESNRSGRSEIWRADRNGGGLMQLTNGGGNTEPSLSPDGMHVIYTASRENKSILWRVSIEGGQPTRISTDDASWAAVSPDGKLIACVFGVAGDAMAKRIAILPFAGGDPVKTYSMAKHGIGYNRLRWSPDGKAIIYKDLVQGLWRQDIEKEDPELLAGFGETRIFHFAYSGDGKLVYSGGVPTREITILSNFR